MKSGIAVSILDPYDWLPSYGENSVSIESRGLGKVRISRSFLPKLTR